MLARAVLGHGSHNFRRDITHVFDYHVGNVLVRPAGGWLLLSEFLKPGFECKAGGRRFRFQRRRLFIGKLNHHHKKSPRLHRNSYGIEEYYHGVIPSTRPGPLSGGPLRFTLHPGKAAEPLDYGDQQQSPFLPGRV